MSGLIKIRGDLLASDATFICHQVNCMGVMGSGVAKQVREKWPHVYKDYCDAFYRHSNEMELMGEITVTPINNAQFVVNMFSQYKYGYDGQRYTNYEAFARCLERIHAVSNPGDTIAFPRLIGCDRGGANWAIIKTMIEEMLPDREIEIYCLHGGPEECMS